MKPNLPPFYRLLATAALLLDASKRLQTRRLPRTRLSMPVSDHNRATASHGGRTRRRRRSDTRCGQAGAPPCAAITAR